MSIRKVNQAIARFLRRIWWKLGDKYRDVTIVWPDNFRRMVKFIPAIWNDWDFDAALGTYGYLRTKLALVEPCLRDGHLENGVKYADEMKTVISALDRLIADEYDEVEFVPIDEKYGKPAFDFVPYKKNSTIMVDLREEGMSIGEKEQKRKSTRDAFYEAERKRTEDIKFVFDTIRDKHRYWWD